MIISGGNVLLQDFCFHKTDVSLENGVIAATGKLSDEGGFDARDCYVIPGLVDIHIHGACGHDFCGGTREDFSAIARFLAGEGVTSFLGTALAYDLNAVERAFANAADYIDKPEKGCATMRGLNMEGPFFNKKKKGAQPARYIIDPDISVFERLNRAGRGNVRLCSVAPELKGAQEFISEISKKATISLGHTEANYDEACRAFAAGASHVTHTFNAMPPFLHRAPSVVGAAFDYAKQVELISDGYHVAPSVVRAAFKLFGAQRLCLVSDAVMACGMPEGKYTLGGHTVLLKGRRATLRNGALAGSASSLMDCVRAAVSFGIGLEDAVRSASATPARAAGISDKVGSIECGKLADVVVLDKGLRVRAVFLRGELR